MALADILAHPLLYMAYQGLGGGVRARRLCMERNLQPGPSLNVLDIGCGPGYGIRYFKNPAFYGYDVSESYIHWASAKYGDRATFTAREFTEAELAHVPPMDVVLLMGLLHHLDDHQSQQLMSLVYRALKPGGVAVTLDGCYVAGQSGIAKWFLDGDRGKFVRDEPGYLKLARPVFDRVESTIHHDYFRIPYSIAIMKCYRDATTSAK